METKLQLINEITKGANVLFLITDFSELPKKFFSEGELKYIQNKLETNDNLITVNSYSHISIILKIETKDKESNQVLEDYRNKANDSYEILQKHKLDSVQILGLTKDETLAFAEGLMLSTYRFNKYFTDKKDKENYLQSISLQSKNCTEEDLKIITNNCKANFICRDLVNEPVSTLNTQKFAESIREIGTAHGIQIEILNKQKIEALRMGGLLGVNKGSIDPPAFAILEWKPKSFKNKKPIVLVGKGIVYDTGGLNIKTANYMDDMKSDMGGGATVLGSMVSAASNNIQLHIIGLIPITDNRLNGNAYASGDILNMHNGLTVEVLNTDAEGRLALADALSYAQKYDPELVIDFATLTGSAVMALGDQAAVMMGNASSEIKNKLVDAGNLTFERLVEFPFYDEYKKQLESPIADIKNIGGREAGAITAGKFLEYFTKYPYIHIDIAGTAFLTTANKYRAKGGTGFGIRMMFSFFKHIL